MQKSKLQFTQEKWAEEMSKIEFCGQHQGLGSCNLPCPSCGTLGFYGPRRPSKEVTPTRKYRACKFCGFWQEVFGKIYDQRGGKPYRCIMIQCKNCETYSWRLPWSDDWGQCEKCKNEDLKQVPWPTEDLSHPFHRIKAEMDRIHKKTREDLEKLTKKQTHENNSS